MAAPCSPKEAPWTSHGGPMNLWQPHGPHGITWHSMTVPWQSHVIPWQFHGSAMVFPRKSPEAMPVPRSFYRSPMAVPWKPRGSDNVSPWPCHVPMPILWQSHDSRPMKKCQSHGDPWPSVVSMVLYSHDASKKPWQSHGQHIVVPWQPKSSGTPTVVAWQCHEAMGVPWHIMAVL